MGHAHRRSRQFLGRFFANVVTTTALSIPFTATFPRSAPMSLATGLALQGTASVGAALRTVQDGVTDPVSIFSRGFYGMQ